jgi:pimeloyl-ACP methyl ester carboxylesterase
MLPEPFSHVRDVVELVGAADVSQAVVVGGSLGGRVALELAVARPTLVGALVLVSPSLPGHDWSSAVRAFGEAEDDALDRGDIDTAVELNVRMWFDGHGRSSTAVDATRRAAVADMQRRAFELQLAAGEDAVEEPLVGDLRTRLAELNAPTLVVVGEYDVADFHAIGAQLAAELPNAEYRLFPGAAHVPNYERPEAFNVLLTDALAQFA